MFLSINFFWCLFLISIPHWLYAFIWIKPKLYMKLSRKYLSDKLEPIVTFTYLASLLKPVQFIAFLAWYCTIGSISNIQLDVFKVLISLSMIVFGQILNVGIYKAVGANGVYYGIKLGKKIPWCTGFPFTVVDHPQYVGSVLTAWGGIILLMTNDHLPELYYIMAYIPLLYTISGYIESHF